MSAITQHQVSVAAEAFVAALFAQAGYNVSVQYGANQPEYDLLVEKKGGNFMKVSVKGSQDGGWGLTQSYKLGRTYHEAIDYWQRKHSDDIVFAFVQFQNIPLGEMPVVYLATISEVAKALKLLRRNKGDTRIQVNHTWKSGVAKGVTDVMNPDWKFSLTRIEQIIANLKSPTKKKRHED